MSAQFCGFEIILSHSGNRMCVTIDLHLSLVRCSISVLVFGCWLMYHLIHLKMWPKKMLLQTFFCQNGRVCKKLKFWVKIVVILWICSALNKSYFCLSLRCITWFMSQQPKTNTDVEHLGFILFFFNQIHRTYLPGFPDRRTQI